MQTNKFPLYANSSSIKLSLLLILWMIGIILGAFAGSSFSASSVSLMKRALFTPVSIVSLFVCAAIPFALTAAAVFCCRFWLIYFLCIVKAFVFAYTGSVCLACFGSGGWLARILLFFTQISTVPALWYVWLSLCPGKRKLNRFNISLLLLHIVSVVALDYYKIVPFVGKLTS